MYVCVYVFQITGGLGTGTAHGGLAKSHCRRLIATLTLWAGTLLAVRLGKDGVNEIFERGQCGGNRAVRNRRCSAGRGNRSNVVVTPVVLRGRRLTESLQKTTGRGKSP